MELFTTSSSKSSKGLGNTKPNPKQVSPAKRWCFTLNNYTKEEISSIVPIIKEKCKLALIAKETGEEGTSHLQGFIELKTKARPKSVIKNDRIHWESAKGNNQHQLDYISKECDPFINIGFPKKVKLIEERYFFDWQNEIVNIVKSRPDNRTIYWYWSEEGCVGKTMFCKYLTVNHGAIALSGKSADMKNGIVEYTKSNNGLTPELILIPIPRSFNTDYLNYEGIENVKDMYFYSGKYEGGMICGNCPHVFVFANEPPDVDKMSKDRWVVYKID